ncbi:Fpg/Nei family DNA glycosylase [Arsenicicoccus piscis]|uniref:DNA-(apurinic or apyrimidinic site) lyase n=1 Tax=Arsenicicoccus piscis TaxID=673954 RepID=A0ABQ6HRL8_9MICO|nr:DNA-formamidopyrimidine glycosylase family protein [Arsenicicoccus piscis]GMA21101.1 endonuclease VIII [Arsenicicoccus piscis]
MPEGHTIHAIAGRIEHAFGGTRPEVSSPQGRFAESAALLQGRELVSASAAGKHLFVEFTGDAVVNVHLGLIGSWVVHPGPAALNPVTGQVRLRIAGELATADLRGPNVCALITPEQQDAILARLGPDPLREDADPERARTRIQRSRKGIGELLMDQAVLAGVGNVYRCEVLYRHRVDPFTPGNALKRKTFDAMWADLVRLLRIGLTYNQILTMDDQIDEAEALIAAGDADTVQTELTGRRLGEHFERRFWLYKRTGEPCLVCGSKVRSQVVAGRNLYWCGRCQRRH